MQIDAIEGHLRELSVNRYRLNGSRLRTRQSSARLNSLRCALR